MISLLCNSQNVKTIKGIVVNKGYSPIIACNAVIKGSTIGTVTDVCGEFSLPLAQGDFTLLFHCMSYNDLRTYEIELSAKTINDEPIVFQLGRWKMNNEHCKKAIGRNFKKHIIK